MSGRRATPRMMATKRPPRPMARRRREIEASAARHRLARTGGIAGSVVLLLAAFIVTGLGMSGRPAPSASPSARLAAGVDSSAPATAPSMAAATTPRSLAPTRSPSPPPEPTASTEPTEPTELPGTEPPVAETPTPSPTPVATPQPTPSTSPPHGSAPTSAATFDRRWEVVPMAWPLDRRTSFRYRDNYHEGRFGEPEPYNHWFSRTNGVLRRAHDGVDIYARRGARVLAPLSGTVIDPSKRWKPWRPDRYGRVVVIVSDELTSVGYAVILAHLDRTVVQVGDHVERGEYVGTNGTTGNAQGGPAHIHLELRAPFMIRWKELGKWRLVDAFDPYASLRMADPRRD